MEILAVLGVGTIISIIRIMYMKKGKSVSIKKGEVKETKIRVLNLSDRAVKQKKYQLSINERTKGIL